MTKQDNPSKPNNHAHQLSLDSCKAILNQNGNTYSDEDIKQIREFIYALIEIDICLFQHFLDQQIREAINLTEDQTIQKQRDEKESHYLHQGIDR